jgi:type III restriction enzyme
MELKDFQQRVLDTLDSYLDELKSSQANYLKIVAHKQEYPELDLPLPDFTERAWEKMRVGAYCNTPLPPVRHAIPFSPRIDGVGRLVPFRGSTRGMERNAPSRA